MMRVVERREWLEGDEAIYDLTFEEARTAHRRTIRASREIFDEHPLGLTVARHDRSPEGDRR